ncbi:SMI1/KNR4 family protein [Pseudomonas sp. Fl5BN2]|uniref:SMI1/KNR4 family protein n=1 Tax=unclassified Pseudomonas TaxID=196821 RepID=UPI001378D8F8|nr:MULTISPECIES: SMI1/KNR4 family protein [unclassified Pseudomonas]NBF05571.1 SMI1/KNR4 family protein [Pseudomonas sp. Fl5BN2]NBF10610.1 SMI1/KNR4 family protein [Pseudomonas sp. Fl4BN1]
MIPKQLMALIEAQPNPRPRIETAKVTHALKTLGIALDSEFAQIYLACHPADFESRASYEVLMDIAEPTEQILIGTEFIHEVWELPKNFIAFTSLQAEGGYLLDKDSGGVWDFGLENWEDFVAGRMPARWGSFFEFVTWLLSADAPDDD